MFKLKKLTLAIPMVTILASCSAKVVVYRDIFKDAKDLPDAVKEEAFTGYSGYNATSTHVNTLHIISPEEDHTESVTTYEYVASVVKDDENPGNNAVFYKNVTKDEVRADLHYNVETESFEGTIADPELDRNAYYELMRDLVFPWKGRYDVGNFETNIYEENTKLLNAVSANATISPKNGVKTGNFTISLKSVVSVKDASSTTRVTEYRITYQNLLMRSFKCTSSLFFQGPLYEIIVTDSITTTFTYE